MNEKEIFGISPCCKADILDPEEKLHPASCSECKEVVTWAFADSYWEKHEAGGVVEDFNGDRWFFWSQTSNPLVARTIYEKDPDSFVCHVRELVDTVTLRHDKYGDMISPEDHLQFLKDYEDQVKNPERAKRYFWYSNE